MTTRARPHTTSTPQSRTQTVRVHVADRRRCQGARRLGTPGPDAVDVGHQRSRRGRRREPTLPRAELLLLRRSRWQGEAFGLTVDWAYPYFTAADKKQIRKVFLRWASEQYTAFPLTELTGSFPSPRSYSPARRSLQAGTSPMSASHPTPTRPTILFHHPARDCSLSRSGSDSANDHRSRGAQLRTATYRFSIAALAKRNKLPALIGSRSGASIVGDRAHDS